MLYIPNGGRWRAQHNWGSVATATPGASVTTGGTAATKGTPVEIFSSTNFDTCLVAIGISEYAAAATASRLMVDLLIGAATESVLINNLVGSHGGATYGGLQYYFPLYIPAGSRVAVQAAGDRTTTACRVQVALYGGLISSPWQVGSGVETYGVGTVPAGTAVTPGNAADGAWVQMTSSSLRNHFAWHAALQHPTDTSWGSARIYQWELGVGGAGSEVLIQEGGMFAWDSNEAQHGPTLRWPIMADIPAASAMSTRWSGSGTLETGDYQTVLYGVY